MFRAPSLSRREFFCLSAAAGLAISSESLVAQELSALASLTREKLERTWQDNGQPVKGSLTLVSPDTIAIWADGGAKALPRKTLAEADKAFIDQTLRDFPGVNPIVKASQYRETGPFELKLYDFIELREAVIPNRFSNTVLDAREDLQPAGTDEKGKFLRVPGCFPGFSFLARPGAVLIADTTDMHQKWAEQPYLKEVAPSDSLQIPERVSLACRKMRTPLQAYFLDCPAEIAIQSVSMVMQIPITIDRERFDEQRKQIKQKIVLSAGRAKESFRLITGPASDFQYLAWAIGLLSGGHTTWSNDGKSLAIVVHRGLENLGLTATHCLPANVSQVEAMEIFANHVNPFRNRDDVPPESRFSESTNPTQLTLTIDPIVHQRFAAVLSAFSQLRERIGTGPRRRDGKKHPNSDALPDVKINSKLSRQWKAKAGNFAVEARIIAATPTRIALQKPDGKITYPALTVLSDEDSQFVKKMFVATSQQRMEFEPLRAGVYLVRNNPYRHMNPEIMRKWQKELHLTAPGRWFREVDYREVNYRHPNKPGYNVSEDHRKGQVTYFADPPRLICFANTEVHSWIKEDLGHELERIDIESKKLAPPPVKKWTELLAADLQCSFQATSKIEIAATLSSLLEIPFAFDETQMATKKIQPADPIDFVTMPGQGVLSVLESLGTACGGSWAITADELGVTLGTDPRSYDCVLKATHHVPAGLSQDDVYHSMLAPLFPELFNKNSRPHERCIIKGVSSVDLTSSPFMHLDGMNLMAHCDQSNRTARRNVNR